MNKRIFKYALPLTEQFTLDLPGLIRVLTVQVQREQPYLWAEVYPDPYAPAQQIEFRWIPTGGKVDQDVPLNYEGTVQLSSGYFVVHLYRVIA